MEPEGVGATKSPVNTGESPHSRGEWEREDSNLRRLSRQIYSLLPLSTRAHSHNSIKATPRRAVRQVFVARDAGSTDITGSG